MNNIKILFKKISVALPVVDCQKRLGLQKLIKEDIFVWNAKNLSQEKE